MSKPGRVLSIVACVVILWLAVTTQHKNAEIERLNGDLTSASAETAAARGDVDAANARFEAFKANVAELATRDMIANVNDAAGMGGAVASGCGVGYSKPGCDWWFEPAFPQGPPEAARWGARAVAQFSLGTMVKTYGDGLVERSLPES